MVAEHDAAHEESSRDGKFEGVAFHLAGDGAEDGEAGFLVVAGVAEHDGGAATGLVAACLRIEHEPADGTEFGHGRCMVFMQGEPHVPRLPPNLSRGEGSRASLDRAGRRD